MITRSLSEHDNLCFDCVIIIIIDEKSVKTIILSSLFVKYFSYSEYIFASQKFVESVYVLYNFCRGKNLSDINSRKCRISHKSNVKQIIRRTIELFSFSFSISEIRIISNTSSIQTSISIRKQSRRFRWSCEIGSQLSRDIFVRDSPLVN